MNPYRATEAASGGRTVPGVYSGTVLLIVLLAVPCLFAAGVVFLANPSDNGRMTETIAVLGFGGSLLAVLLVPVARFFWQWGELAFLQERVQSGGWTVWRLLAGVIPGISLFVPFLFQSHMANVCRAALESGAPERLSLRHRWAPVRGWWLAALLGPGGFMAALAFNAISADTLVAISFVVGAAATGAELPLLAVVVAGAMADQRLLRAGDRALSGGDEAAEFGQQEVTDHQIS